jgi:anionic cell wall polymer biosynthesis LytR-Cps2A-Psr (LCP) family protein
VYFNYPSRDQKTGLFQYDPGCVTLDGDQALAYARSRHFEIQKTPNGRWQEDPASDLGRITRQQQFIKAALRKAVSTGVRNPFVLKDLVGIAQKNVTLDTEFSIQDLIDLGMQFREFDPDELLTYQPQVESTMIGAMSVLSLDQAASAPIFDIFRGVTPIPTDPAAIAATTSSTTAPGAPTTATTAPLSTTTTLSDFIPQAPEGESCG